LQKILFLQKSNSQYPGNLAEGEYEFWLKFGAETLRNIATNKTTNCGRNTMPK
jgi:hypothetical protein